MSENRAAVDRAMERWNAGDLPGYLQLYDDGVRLHGFGPEPLDRQAVTAFYETIWAAFAQPTLELDEVLEAGDAIVIRFTMHGRHDGTFMDVPGSGHEIHLAGITILHFDDDSGRCVERWSQVDMLGLAAQIGAFAGPA